MVFITHVIELLLQQLVQ